MTQNAGVSRVYMGVDPSLNSSGVAVRVGGRPISYCIGGGGRKDIHRIRHVRDALEIALRKYSPTLVAFEGLAMGFSPKTSNNVLNLAELAGVLKLLISDNEIDILLVPPTSLKLFAAGKGNAKKEAVSAAIESACGASFSTSDQYDAVGLLMMAEAYYAARKRRFEVGYGLTAHRAKALASCTVIQAV